jgi:predicted transcriptional regulator
MKLSRVREIINGIYLTGDPASDPEATNCMGSDMMSDVLAFAQPGAILITGLINAQSVRTADIADSVAVIYVRGKKPEDSVIELAKELSIPLISTEMGMFDTCGALAKEGLTGIC